MENKKYILGLDVSTSTIGACIFEDMGNYGDLKALTHFQPTFRSKTKLEELVGKADTTIEQIINYLSEHSISKIDRLIIEKPLPNSSNQKTAAKLAMFNEYLSYHLGLKLGVSVEFVTVHDARKYGLPELVGKNGRMFSDFPKTVGGLSKSKWSKFLIMYLVSQRYPDVTWVLNQNLKVSKKNFDRADSIVACLGYMIKDGAWKEMGEKSFWGDVDFSYERCGEIIKKNIAYETMAKKHVDKNKEFSPDEKRKIKKKYLNEVFKIKAYLNVEY